MKEELKKKVKKHMQKKKSFFIVSIIFISISILLLIISSQAPIDERIWINFPSFVLLMVLGIIYISMFGLRRMESALFDEEDEIEESIARLYEYKTRNKTPRLDLTEDEKLELLELEELKEKIEREI